MQKIVLFRISSKGYPKVKVDWVNKYDSLKNLSETFQGWKFICVADNCDEALIEHIKVNYQFDQLIETKLGNPGSFWKLYEIALDIARDDDIFYFIEDLTMSLSMIIQININSMMAPSIPTLNEINIQSRLR
jgi:hypothetical protein